MPVEPDIVLPHAARPRPHARAAILFAAAVSLLVTLSIAVLSLDSPTARRGDPRTEDAYVGGDVTAIAARVAGFVRLLPIGDNQTVRAGQVIAKIEDDDLRAEAARAAAEAGVARARLDALDAQILEASQQLDQSRAGQAGAQSDTARTNPELVRQRALLGTDEGVPRLFEQARAEQLQADARVDASRALVVVRERQLDAMRTARREALAAVDQALAALRERQIRLGWAEIRAPVDGTLGPRLVRVGALLAPGQAIATITPLNGVWVDANFTERQITFIRVGQPATLVLDAFPGRKLQGHVAGMSPATGAALSPLTGDDATGNFTKVVQRVPVRIAIDRNGSTLRGLVRPGMSVTATVRASATPPETARATSQGAWP